MRTGVACRHAGFLHSCMTKSPDSTGRLTDPCKYATWVMQAGCRSAFCNPPGLLHIIARRTYPCKESHAGSTHALMRAGCRSAYRSAYPHAAMRSPCKMGLEGVLPPPLCAYFHPPCRYKKTVICQEVAKAKNVCQASAKSATPIALHSLRVSSQHEDLPIHARSRLEGFIPHPRLPPLENFSPIMYSCCWQLILSLPHSLQLCLLDLDYNLSPSLTPSSPPSPPPPPAGVSDRPGLQPSPLPPSLTLPSPCRCVCWTWTTICPSRFATTRSAWITRTSPAAVSERSTRCSAR